MNEWALSAWQIDESDFPAGGSIEEKLRFAVNYAILAPSSHNTQPWRFLIQRDTVQVCADRSRALPVTDPFDRELLISCGAAIQQTVATRWREITGTTIVEGYGLTEPHWIQGAQVRRVQERASKKRHWQSAEA